MRCLISLLVLSIAAPAYARATHELAAPPPGATLPVVINRTLKLHDLRPGKTISAELAQTVPVRPNVELPRDARLEGRVVTVSDSSVSILFDHLSWKGRTIPVHVRLIAAAGMMNVSDTKLPLAPPDRGTANPGDWTTRQVGGDEVYLSGWSGKVYDHTVSPLDSLIIPACMPTRRSPAHCLARWALSRRPQPACMAFPNFLLRPQEEQTRRSRSPRANLTGSSEMAALCCSRWYLKKSLWLFPGCVVGGGRFYGRPHHPAPDKALGLLGRGQDGDEKRCRHPCVHKACSEVSSFLGAAFPLR